MVILVIGKESALSPVGNMGIVFYLALPIIVATGVLKGSKKRTPWTKNLSGFLQLLGAPLFFKLSWRQIINF